MSVADRLIEIENETDLTRARALLGQEGTAAAAIVSRAADAESPERIDELLADLDRIRAMCEAVKAKL